MICKLTAIFWLELSDHTLENCQREPNQQASGDLPKIRFRNIPIRLVYPCIRVACQYIPNTSSPLFSPNSEVFLCMLSYSSTLNNTLPIMLHSLPLITSNQNLSQNQRVMRHTVNYKLQQEVNVSRQDTGHS